MVGHARELVGPHRWSRLGGDVRRLAQRPSRGPEKQDRSRADAWRMGGCGLGREGAHSGHEEAPGLCRHRVPRSAGSLPVQRSQASAEGRPARASSLRTRSALLLTLGSFAANYIPGQRKSSRTVFPGRLRGRSVAHRCRVPRQRGKNSGAGRTQAWEVGLSRAPSPIPRSVIRAPTTKISVAR